MRIKFLDKMKSELYRARLAVFVVFAFCMGAVFAFLATSNTKNTNATTAGFKAGNIMTDYVMSNSNTMSVSDIQNFLTRKNPCNYRDYNKYISLMNSNAAKNKGYRWHWDNGHFVCLSEERFDGQSAAQIIYDAAQDYHINPQVLIVLLEKEQGLITDKYPNNIQYRSATGYGCPDTAACNTKYYGFKNQVRNAAALFHQVLTGGWSNYHVGNNQVAYHPNAACGRSNVYIENLATAALYRYTPYQPNSAALSWSGDGCSSYGNRNFYHYFTEWFGSTQQDVPIAHHQVIEDGEYTIVADTTYDTALTATGTAAGSNVSMNTRTGAANQKWQVTYHDNDATYSFTNKATGLALDIHGASTTSGANIEVFTKNNNCNQRWRAVANNDGTVGFVSACSTSVALDVYGASKANGANVQSYSYHGETAQRWRIIPDAAVADGLYSISPRHEGSLTLDVFGGYTTPQTNVQVYTNHESPNEKWNLQYNKQDGTYKITSLNSGLALDVFGGYGKNGTNVQMYSYHGGCGQNWYIIPNGNGHTIVSACSGLALDVYGAVGASGTNVQIWQQNNADNQTWTIKSTIPGALPDGIYSISAEANGNLALDANSGSNSGENVRIYDKNNSNAQRWKLTGNSDGTYFITNAASGLSLDVYGGYAHDEANVQIFTAHHGQNQKWKIDKNTNGSYTISSVNSGKPLDVYGGGTTSDSNVQQFSWHGGKNQQWRIVKE